MVPFWPFSPALAGSEQCVSYRCTPGVPDAYRTRHDVPPAQNAGTRYSFPAGSTKTTSSVTSLNGSSYFLADSNVTSAITLAGVDWTAAEALAIGTWSPAAIDTKTENKSACLHMELLLLSTFFAEHELRGALHDFDDAI